MPKGKKRKSHNFQLKPGYRANYACTYCGVDMIGDSRADNPCKNAELYVINQELNELPWDPPLATSVPRNGGDLTINESTAADDIGLEFTEKEKSVIAEISNKQELRPAKVIKQALATYQLIVMGSHELREVNPELGSIES